MTVFVLDGNGNIKGHASYETTYLENNEEIIEVTESELADVFEDAKASGETLDGPDKTIDAAIDDPLSFLDFLILADGSIEFDDGYVRETPETQA